MAYFYILLTILLTVFGQIVVKWQVNLAGDFPADIDQKFAFLGRLLLNPWVISSFAAAFIASLTWMAALTQLPLSVAYPFMSLSFLFVMILSYFLFKEPITLSKTLCLAFVITGLIIGNQK
jgi:multidrug transporter EmrE-like cation transporter